MSGETSTLQKRLVTIQRQINALKDTVIMLEQQWRDLDEEVQAREKEAEELAAAEAAEKHPDKRQVTRKSGGGGA